ncbi:hypothetical protein ATCC90586_010544 [Pythium insidiosum]|nr:hypothetical protein ATCC90586_010544 [Pythium insidiosum]
MVLRCFDFTIDHRVNFNVDDLDDMASSSDWDESELVRAAIDEWEAAHPNEGVPPLILTEGFAYWLHFDVFFHPQQYGFLRKIQYGELDLDAWPEHEDPFTLFYDLAFIKDKFTTFRWEMQTHSDGEQFLHPVFLSSYRNQISRRDYAFLEHS